MIGRRLRRHVVYPEGYTGPICPQCTHPLEETDHPRKGFHCPYCKRYYFSKPRKADSMHIQLQGGDLKGFNRKPKQPRFFPKESHKGKGWALGLVIVGLIPLLYWLLGDVLQSLAR